jgi:hypothetical protein
MARQQGPPVTQGTQKNTRRTIPSANPSATAPDTPPPRERPSGPEPRRPVKRGA